MPEPQFEKFSRPSGPSLDAMIERSRVFYEFLKTRRSIRKFSQAPVDRKVIENCLLAAGTAPNGANHQPWHFVVVENPSVKKQIRESAEKEETEFYQRRAPKEWLEALAPLGTNESKPFLEEAPYLIAIFAQKKSPVLNGSFKKNYYVNESVGIATGMLITALHDAGLSTLTHTPSPMKFLNRILCRPDYEKPFLLLVVGKPSDEAVVPCITKKTLNEIATFF